MTVRIQSAIALESEQKEQLEKVIAKVIDEPEFMYLVDKKILGGLRVTVGSRRIDLSLAGRLSQVESQIH